jgi:trehalose 6-phosphate phosphatase
MASSDALSSPPPLAALLESGRVALFVDFDGTLVEIASGPDAIAVADSLGRSLEALAGHLGGALALVSGRSIESLTSFLGPVSLHLAGSHGGHVQHANGDTLREAEPLPEAVGAALGQYAQRERLLYERKAHGAALHYRARPEFADQAHDFARKLAVEHDLATKCGKCVIELVRPRINKGGAVRLLSEQAPFAGAIPIFIGDDVTDEDGFAACKELGGFGILVGSREETSASHRLENVGEVHRWLDL